jgi:glycosyltransferase involved in cell wall biosynthesis
MSKVLVISPEAILPPVHGGSLRSAHLIAGLGKTFEVRALLPQDEQSIGAAIAASGHLAGPQWIAVVGHSAYRIGSIRDKLRMKYWNRREHQDRKKWATLPWGWFLGTHHSWKIILKEMSASWVPDCLMVEHTRNAGIFSYARKLWPNVLCVCNSHNVESNLFRQVLPEDSNKQGTIRAIERYEKQMLSRSDLLWGCSQDDLDRYLNLGVRAGATGVVPNGVDARQVHFIEYSPKGRTVVFIGNMAYEPNVEGALWFREKVWPLVKQRIPGAKWQLVGSWPAPEVAAMAGGDIHLAANVLSVRPYLEEAAVAICPLFSGSGTRLKILEAFSAGVPMVSTSVGAEGLEFEEGVHLCIRDSAEDFAAAIVRLMENPVEREAMRRAARVLAEKKYDWEVISASAAEQLMSLLPPERETKSS